MKEATKWQVISTTDVPARQHGKKEIVALTVRLQRAEWERLHRLAVSEGMSAQALTLCALNRVFAEKGLPPLRKELIPIL